MCEESDSSGIRLVHTGPVDPYDSRSSGEVLKKSFGNEPDTAAMTSLFNLLQVFDQIMSHSVLGADINEVPARGHVPQRNFDVLGPDILSAHHASVVLHDRKNVDRAVRMENDFNVIRMQGLAPVLERDLQNDFKIFSDMQIP